MKKKATKALEVNFCFDYEGRGNVSEKGICVLSELERILLKCGLLVRETKYLIVAGKGGYGEGRGSCSVLF